VAPVLHHVGDARRHPQVVLQDIEAAVGPAHHVDAGDVDANPVGRVEVGGLAQEPDRGGHQPPGHDPVVEDLLAAVDIGQEGLQSPHPLGHPRLDDRPLLGGDDAGEKVEGEGALLTREGEGDALVPQAAVPDHAPVLEVVHRQGLESAVQRSVGGTRGAHLLEHLVPGGPRDVTLEEVAHELSPPAGRFAGVSGS
jgi:hypothetical protein